MLIALEIVGGLVALFIGAFALCYWLSEEPEVPYLIDGMEPPASGVSELPRSDRPHRQGLANYLRDRRAD